MATTNADRQAVFRQNQAAKFEQVSTALAAATEENRTLRAQNEELQKRLTAQEAASAKKVAGLEKRLLSALEKLSKVTAG